MKKTPIVLGVVIIIGLGAYYLFFSQGYGQKATGTPTPTPQMVNGQSAAVSLNNFSFDPATLTIKTGTTVTWTNNDAVSHTVTSDTGNLLSSPVLSPGQSFSFTFISPGSVNYHCNIHRTMKGAIIINN